MLVENSSRQLLIYVALFTMVVKICGLLELRW